MSIQGKRRKNPRKREKIFAHRHCNVCNRIIPEFSDGYCSQECRDYRKNRRKGRGKQLIKWISTFGVMIALIIILLVVMSP